MKLIFLSFFIALLGTSWALQGKLSDSKPAANLRCNFEGMASNCHLPGFEGKPPHMHPKKP